MNLFSIITAAKCCEMRSRKKTLKKAVHQKEEDRSIYTNKTMMYGIWRPFHEGERGNNIKSNDSAGHLDEINVGNNRRFKFKFDELWRILREVWVRRRDLKVSHAIAEMWKGNAHVKWKNRSCKVWFLWLSSAKGNYVIVCVCLCFRGAWSGFG